MTFHPWGRRIVQTIQNNCLVDNHQIINALEQKPDNLTISEKIKFFSNFQQTILRNLSYAGCR